MIATDTLAQSPHPCFLNKLPRISPDPAPCAQVYGRPLDYLLTSGRQILTGQTQNPIFVSVTAERIKNNAPPRSMFPTRAQLAVAWAQRAGTGAQPRLGALEDLQLVTSKAAGNVSEYRREECALLGKACEVALEALEKKLPTDAELSATLDSVQPIVCTWPKQKEPRLVSHRKRFSRSFLTSLQHVHHEMEQVLEAASRNPVFASLYQKETLNRCRTLSPFLEATIKHQEMLNQIYLTMAIQRGLKKIEEPQWHIDACCEIKSRLEQVPRRTTRGIELALRDVEREMQVAVPEDEQALTKLRKGAVEQEEHRKAIQFMHSVGITSQFEFDARLDFALTACSKIRARSEYNQTVPYSTAWYREICEARYFARNLVALFNSTAPLVHRYFNPTAARKAQFSAMYDVLDAECIRLRGTPEYAVFEGVRLSSAEQAFLLERAKLMLPPSEI